MRYFLQTFTSLLVPAIFFGGTLFTILHFTALRKKSYSRAKNIWSFIFMVYIFIVLLAVWYGGISVEGESIRMNLRPFKSIREGLDDIGMTSGWPTSLITTLLNIAMFVPLGFLVPTIFEKFRTLWKVFIVSFLFTLIIETGQLLVFVSRSFDVDDLICNTLGGIIGFSLYVILLFVRDKLKNNQSKISLADKVVSMVVLTLVFTVPTIYFINYSLSEYGKMSIRKNPLNIDLPNETILPTNTNLSERAVVYKRDKNEFDTSVTMDELKEKFKIDGEPYYQSPNDKRFYLADGNEGTISINTWNNTWSYHLNNFPEYEDLKEETADDLAIEYLKKMDLWNENYVLIKDRKDFLNPENDVYFMMKSDHMNMYEGWVTVKVHDDSLKYGISNGIEKFDFYAHVNIVTPQEAVDRFKRNDKGEVWCNIDDIDSVIINDVKIQYRREANKNLLIPIYMMSGDARKGSTIENIKIYLPAMK